MKYFYKMNIVILFITLMFLGSQNIYSQNLDETLSNLSSDAAKQYVGPVVNAFGSNLNSGWVAKVPSTKLGLTVELKFIGVGTVLSNSDQTFATSGTFHYTDAQAQQILQASGINPGDANYASIKNEILSKEWAVNMSGPTINGSKDEYLNVEFPGATIQGQQVGKYNTTIEDVKGYLNKLSIFPSAAAQLTLGTVAGTQVSFRYFPKVDVKDLGKFEWFGFGFIHNPAYWLKNPLPVDIGIGYFYQKLKVGDIFESKTTQVGIYASKSFGFIFAFIPYVGLTTETSKTTVTYDYSYDTPAGSSTAKINFDLEGKNTVGFTLGVAVKLAVANLNIDYKLAKVNTFSAGLSFGLL